ncbi:methyltransferase family protein [Bacteroides zoogleoformans]|uniref:Class I SAM-dependent methyltransferase n=1 Tax=Bacteroides zoogleoformans TaxID=28119 RepID=A0ABM6T728_9BACE|nr:class I SAM-dependent methyltransferase [Bacteroides zoogleoformans]AVM52596.1 class I SAM-dependent methyltransferase [Bacteroides zoogleoformans]TWJ14154.1 methyltransferase family protein [Bacteroides zoogleoformans]
MEDYYKTNKEAWNARTKIHLRSSFYDLDKFKREVKSVPDLDVSLLGDIRGKSILHLQCHFGMDTLSLSKMGANVVGVDFSEEAIQTAEALNAKLGLNAQFCCCNIYDAPAVLRGQQFDIVYTSYGVVNWLPDLVQWGQVISQMLKDDGKFVIVEFHPVLWMFNEDFSQVRYAYSRKKPYVVEETTYTDSETDNRQKTVTWNHGLAEVLNGLLRNGLQIKSFGEYDYSPFNLFGNMITQKNGTFKIAGKSGRIPMSFSVVAMKTFNVIENHDKK